MELTEKAEEILETLWIRMLEEKQGPVPEQELEANSDQPLTELLSAGYITRNNSLVGLTEEGRPSAENVVRRHRLAERLLVDVLDAGDEVNHEKACKFEHLLDRGLDDAICSLLGHPKVCPHGKPIPQGNCCRQMRESASRLVSPLSQLMDGQEGKVAYIYAPKLDQLQKLTAMGILPGVAIRVTQTFPTYVFEVGQSQFAVDKDIAEAIYIRLSAEKIKTINPKPGYKIRERWGWKRW